MDFQTTDIFQLDGDHKRAILKKLLERRDRAVASNHFLKPAGPDRYPLSAGQKGLWMTHQLAPHNYAYNTPLAFRVTGFLDPSALRLALQRLVQRHDALRIRIDIIDGRAANNVAPTDELFFKSEDIAGLDDAAIVARLKKIIRKPFDLKSGPLMRVYLFSKSHTEHILLFNFHHIVFDGGSVAPLLNDLNRLYNAACLIAPDPLPPLGTTYADFVGWQAEMLAGDKGQGHKEYWRKQLKGAPAILELPTDRDRPPIPSLNGAVHRAVFSPGLSTRLKRFSETENVSLFALLLSIFKALLFRYTCQEDILVGTPLEARPGTRFEALIGYFVNMVVIRSAICRDMSFKELLKQVQATAFEALEHGDYPFSEIVRELAPDHDRSRSPLFQTAFAYQNWAMDIAAVGPETPASSGLSFEPMLDIHQEGEFDVTLEVVETATEHHLFFKYNPDLFDEATIIRMAGHFRTLTESIIADPEKAVSRMQLLTKAEQHQILTEFNDAHSDAARDTCIHQLFEAQVDNNPDAVAVVSEDCRLTYRELNARANQLARHLRSLGVGPDVLVGICVDRSLEMIVGLMGILKAGGAYVPLDPNYPQERLALMIEDAGISILLTTTMLSKSLAVGDIGLIALDCADDAIAGLPDDNPVANATAKDLAYVLFTSGSTGTPKGVKVTHSNVLALLDGFETIAPWESMTATGTEATLHGTSVCPYSFDVSVWEFFSILCYGGTLHLLHQEVSGDPNRLANYFIQNNVANAYIPPALLADLVEIFESKQHSLPLKRMLVGVEPIKQETLQRYRDLSAHLYIVNGYGPTEATICATFYNFQDATQMDRRTPIGTAVPGYCVYLVDQNTQLVPIGVTGEIVIGGPGLARGYLNRPEMTTQKFIPNPYSDNPHSRLYKTGDMARMLADGNIEYIGRRDNQVKFRGFRIELGEIEAALIQHDDVSQAVVMLWEDQLGTPQLAAYVASDQSDQSTVDALKRSLKAKLPAYMVPSAIVFLDTFPLTPNGKVDRRALAKPDPAECYTLENYTEPSTNTEKELTPIWAEILGIPRIGIHDDFFDMGGHSLLAIRLIQHIEKVLGAPMPVATLFKAPTIAEMAKLIDDQKTPDTFSPLVGIRPRKEKTPFFCVHPGDGNVFYFTELARLLEESQPFYGLQAYGLEPGTEPLSDIREMAAKYIETIRGVQPHGPYLIGGLCGGGTIAFEMAQQLKQIGEAVPLLVLFDSLAPHMYNPIDETRFFIGFARDFDGLSNANLLPIFQRQRNIDPAEGVAGVRKDLERLNTEERLRILWTCARKAGILQPDVKMEYLARVFDVYSGIYSGILNYDVRSYDGRIVFFRALDEMIDPHADKPASMCRWIEDATSLELVRKFRETPFLGWDRYAESPIQMLDVPGNHFSMLAHPHVNTLKFHLEQRLKVLGDR